MTLLDLSLLQNQQPEEIALPQSVLVAPDILPELLNRRSTLVAAPAGYGKTTLAFLARNAVATWLHVHLSNDDLNPEKMIDSLLAVMTKYLWRYLGAQPATFERLGRRAEAVKYFMRQYVGVEIDYWLETLAEDHPEQASYLHGLARLEPRQIFTETADDELRLGILLDCVSKLGFNGVGIWLDLRGEWKELPEHLQDTLAYLYDFLNLMRNRNLYIKCLAAPSVIRYLQTQRGVSTLSVTALNLIWSQKQLIEIVDRRLAIASQGEILHLGDLINLDDFHLFLHNYADHHSPSAWIDLTCHLARQINRSGIWPVPKNDWLAVRRAYCSEHLKIRRDQEGSFWRGNRLLEGLTPRKRAIYPLVDYLYEHPGIQRTYQLTRQFGVDENILNTTISRARKEHIEPQFEDENENESEFIYLVTDHKGGGYGLQHTDRTP